MVVGAGEGDVGDSIVEGGVRGGGGGEDGAGWDGFEE